MTLTRLILIVALLFPAPLPIQKIAGPSKIVGPTTIPNPATIATLTYTFGQHINCVSSGSTCTITGTFPAGNIGIVQTLMNGTGTTISSISTGGGTWTLSPTVGATSCQKLVSGANVDCAYIKSETSFTGVITVTFSGNAGSGQYSDYSYTGGTPTADAANSGTDTTCTSCAGVALTLTGTSDIITQILSPSNSCSAITGNAFTSPAWTAFVSGNAFAGSAVNTSNGGAPTWTCLSGAATVGAIAFR